MMILNFKIKTHRKVITVKDQQVFPPILYIFFILEVPYDVLIMLTQCLPKLLVLFL